MSPEQFFSAVSRWADEQEHIQAMVLVGSHARGCARVDSDIDLVVLCAKPEHYLDDFNWVSAFGAVQKTVLEDWSKVQSVRVFYTDGLEVEFGITSSDWAAIPLDDGTAEVLASGALVLLDRDGRVTKALQSLAEA